MKLYDIINLCIEGYRGTPDYRDSDTGVEYSIITDIQSNTIGVCFNGSNDLEDWKTNFNFQTFNQGIVKVHPGFAKGYKSIKKELEIDSICQHLPTYTGTNSSEVKIKLFGHSAGGAIAVLAGLDLANKGFDNVRVYTFGSPAVGNLTHANIIDDKLTHYRFYNIFDPVPYLPPKCFGYDFSGAVVFQLAWLWDVHGIESYFKEIQNSRLGKINF